jgi:hypothetical protein
MILDTPRRLESAAPWVAGALLAAPSLVAFYPPMTDLPYHEASIGLLRHFGDPSYMPPGLYELNLGEPNQLFHLLGWLLSYGVSTRWAVKLIVAAGVMAVPVCAARFARHAGASPLAALVVAPMALGWLFSWGLVANLLGLAAFLGVLPVLDAFAANPTRRGAIASVGAAVLLYFAHEAMLFVYGGVALALAVLQPWSRAKTALRLVPFAAGVAIAVAQAKYQVRFMTPAVRSMPTFWHSPWHKLRHVAYIVLPVTDTVVQVAMLVLCVVAIGAFFWLRAQERAGTPPTQPERGVRVGRARAWALRHRWELFAGACFAAYMAFPLTLNGATLVYQRWFPPGYAMLALVAAPRDLWTRAARVARFALPTLPVATLLVAWPSFADSSREYAALEDLLPRIDLGSAAADIDLGPGDPTRTYSLGPASGRILATRGGRLGYAFTDSSVSPVVVARRYQWNEPLVRIGFDSLTFRPEHDFHRFRYVLVRVADPKLAALATFALEPEARYVAEAGEWLLFESRLELVPLRSRDVFVYGPPPETLRERLARLQAPQEEPARSTPEAAGAVPQ